MPKLYSSRHIIKILGQKGFVFVSQKGGHQKYRKADRQTPTTIVPANKKEIPLGTFHSILRQSQLNKEDFIC